MVPPLSDRKSGSPTKIEISDRKRKFFLSHLGQLLIFVNLGEMASLHELSDRYSVDIDGEGVYGTSCE